MDVPYSIIGKHVCGFCDNGSHTNCPGAVLNGANAPFKVLVCPCTEPTCGPAKLRCLRCNTTTKDYIDPARWECISRAECELRQQQYLDGDPLVQSIRSIKEKAMTEKDTTKTPAAKKEPKVGTCIVSGKPTKGGKFAPGQDAKYVSLKVASVIDSKNGKVTEDTVIAEMTKHDLSDALKGKFRKSLALAVARKAKAAAVAAEKEQAKAS